MINLNAVDPTSFLKRKSDPLDPRLAHLALAQFADGESGVSIVGYPDDEGIQLNLGRPGASQGPQEIRHWLYRMTPHPHKELKNFCDTGNWHPDGSIEDRHEHARRHVAHQLKQGHQVLSLGGGNDYAYADGMGFLDQNHESKPLIINVDAHLDVRDLSKGLTSGTPFFRLLESGIPFDFLEIGIQGQCNARSHWEYVENKSGRILSLEEITDSGLSLTEYVLQTVGDWLLKPRPTFLALDMDVFSWPYAIGTSAAWPLGLDPREFQKLAQLLMKRLDVRCYGIYEVSPPLDMGGGTARLAAQFAHGYLHHA